VSNMGLTYPGVSCRAVCIRFHMQVSRCRRATKRPVGQVFDEGWVEWQAA
jgi:hypothetical protein